MSHRTLPLLATLAVTALLGSHAVAADDAPTTKTFDEKGFSITVPSGWSLEDAPEQDAANGYVVVGQKEVSAGVVGKLWVLVKDASGAAADSLLSETRDNVVRGLAEAKAEDTVTQAWGGSDDARMVRIVGKATNGTKSVSKIYGAVANGRFHQLHLRAYGGAEEKLGADFDAIASGYKMLDLVGAAPGEPGAGAEAPKPDARTIRFAKRGFVWKLPAPPAEADAPRWDLLAASEAKPDRAVGEPGLLAVGVLHKEEERFVELHIRAMQGQAGATPKGIINNDENFDDFAKGNFEGTPAPEIDEDYPLGNIRGASRTMTGKGKDGKPLFARIVFVSIRDVIYQVLVLAGGGAEKAHRDAIKAAMAGIQWEDTKEGPRGPWGVPYPSLSQPRKGLAALGQDAKIVALGIEGKKPAAFGFINADPGNDAAKSFVLAAEGRKGAAYMFVGIRKMDATSFQRASPPRDIDSVIDEREGDWKNVVGEPKTATQRGGKATKVVATWQGSKGFTYEFTGEGNGQPVVERGWVVKNGTRVFHVITQYVGVGAEAAFAQDWKSMQSSIRFQ